MLRMFVPNENILYRRSTEAHSGWQHLVHRFWQPICLSQEIAAVLAQLDSKKGIDTTCWKAAKPASTCFDALTKNPVSVK